MNKRYLLNVRIYFWIYILSTLRLFVPIMGQYFKYDIGLTFVEIVAIQAFFTLLSVIFEFPSGVLADTFGRKPVILSGLALSFCAVSVFAAAHSFRIFCLASALAGISNAMISGADSAVLYESLKKLGRAGEFSKIYGRVVLWGLIVFACFSLFVGKAYGILPNLPFFITLIPISVSMVMAFLLKETFSKNHKGGMKERYWGTAKTAIKEILKRKYLRKVIFICAFSIFLLEYVNQTYQPRLTAGGFPAGYLGIVFSVFMICMAFGSRVSFFVLRPKSKKVLPVFTFLLSGLFLLMGIRNVFAFIFVYCLASAGRGIIGPFINSVINKDVCDEYRASALSFYAFFTRLYFAICGLFLAYVADLPCWGIRWSYMFGGATLLLFGLYFCISLRGYLVSENHSPIHI